MKIHKIDGFGVFAVTDIQTKTIVINKHLDKYPELKSHVLKHEKQHIKDNSFFKGFLLDMKDYPKLYSRLDFWQFHKKYVEKPWHYHVRHWIYHGALLMTAPAIGAYCQTKIIIKHLRKRK